MCTQVPKDFHVGGSGERWPPLDCVGDSLQLNHSTATFALHTKGGSPDKLEPSKVEVLHTVRQNIPLSKAIDRANIKETPSPVPLSPQYVKAHPLDLQTPDPLLTPVVTSNIQKATAAMTRIQTHAHPHAHMRHTCAWTRVHMGREHMKQTEDGSRGVPQTRRAWLWLHTFSHKHRLSCSRVNPFIICTAHPLRVAGRLSNPTWHRGRHGVRWSHFQTWSMENVHEIGPGQVYPSQIMTDVFTTTWTFLEHSGKGGGGTSG